MENKTAQYNLNVAPLWNTQNGNLRSMKLDDKMIDAIRQCREGGMLLIKFLADESRTKDTSPHAYVEYVAPEKVASFEATRTGKGQTVATSRTNTPRSEDTL